MPTIAPWAFVLAVPDLASSADTTDFTRPGGGACVGGEGREGHGGDEDQGSESHGALNGQSAR